MSLEGDLSRCRFAGEAIVSKDETPFLKRQTLWPRQDFVVLRLESHAITPLFKQIMAAGLSRSIIHVQIERSGVLELRAYDNFGAGCVMTGPNVSEALLSELQSERVLRAFTAAAGDAERASADSTS